MRLRLSGKTIHNLVPGYVAGKKEEWDDDDKNTAKGAAGIGGLLLALLLASLKTYTVTQRTRPPKLILG